MHDQKDYNDKQIDRFIVVNFTAQFSDNDYNVESININNLNSKLNISLCHLPSNKTYLRSLIFEGVTINHLIYIENALEYNKDLLTRTLLYNTIITTNKFTDNKEQKDVNNRCENIINMLIKELRC